MSTNVQFAIHCLDAIDSEIDFFVCVLIEFELISEITRRAQAKYQH